MNKRIKDKIKEIEEFFGELVDILPSSFDAYTSNIEKKAACERYVEKIVVNSQNTKLIIEKYRDNNESFKMKLIPVARLLISNQKEKLSGRIIELINFGKEYVAKAGLYPANQKSRLISATGSFIQWGNSAVDRKWLDLKSFALKSLANLNVRTTGLENLLKILNPSNVLKRGYTITTKNGRILKSARLVAVDDIVDTQFNDGIIKSKVVKNEPDRSG